MTVLPRSNAFSLNGGGAFVRSAAQIARQVPLSALQNAANQAPAPAQAQLLLALPGAGPLSITARDPMQMAGADDTSSATAATTPFLATLEGDRERYGTALLEAMFELVEFEDATAQTATAAQLQALWTSDEVDSLGFIEILGNAETALEVKLSDAVYTELEQNSGSFAQFFDKFCEVAEAAED